ncbi:MAG: nodulation protein NfeD [Thermoanaerobaculia bacterium]|nr:nodulation protein NfeD [Thermoanaerobaculia bacterium]
MARVRFIVSLLILGFVSFESEARIVKIVVDDLIHPITEEFVERAIELSEESDAEALLIEMRTPGGLETSTREIVNQILASEVPVVIYVYPSGSRAASAGFFILQSADVAAMAPGTNTGAAHPVVMGGEEVGEVMEEKMRNDSAAFMRAIVKKRGRNVEAAEAAVLESKSYTEEEAKELGLIEIIANDQEHLLTALRGREIERFDGTTVELDLEESTIEELEMTLRQQLLSFIMDPNVAFILLSLGMLGLWAEFNNPGAILPGVVGALFILLAVFALNILPVRYAAVGLIILAFILFALEAAFASHGILGAGGVVSLFLGGLLLVDGPVPEMQVHWITALSVSIPLGLIAIFLVTLVIRAHKRQTITGEEGMIGEVGRAETAIDPTGRVFVHGEIWNARSDVPIASGTEIVVRAVKDLLLTVEPAGQAVAEREPED